MASITIVTVGKIKDSWITKGTKEYAKRMSAYTKFSIIEIDEYKIPLKASEAHIKDGIIKEGEKILSKLSARAKVIALCIEGKSVSSEELSKNLDEYGQYSSDIVFIIGSSYGLADSVKKRADLKLSISNMTFPHQLVRLILSEQIYRALSIKAGAKYHK